MAVSVRLDRVSKAFGGARAVNAISLEIEPGELFFLLGPSGCGKTTLLRCIAGFYEPDEGTIALGGRDITRVPPHQRDTGMVFQSYALWPHMTVRENVAFGLEMRRVPRAEAAPRVAEALRMVKMEDRADARPNQLSGGQQQRVALARALVIEPDVVLLDEPLSNLDAKLRLQMRNEIRRIHTETGITMIYVTHDQVEALSMAERMAVMSMGHVEQVGEPRALYRRPANRFVAEFIGEANMIEGKLLRVSDGLGTVETEFGELTAMAGTTGCKPGDAVVCMVRPECLHLSRGERNNIRATVQDSIYLGYSEQFVLEAGGQTHRAVESNPGESPPRVAQAVDVHFSPEDAVILPRE